MLILSLSSIPPRFAHLSATLASLLAQRIPADRIVLNIPHTYRRFPDWDGELPQVPEGVHINRGEDYGPATKLLGALDTAKPDDDILFCDDDRIYDAQLTSRMLAHKSKMSGCAIAENGYHLSRYGVAVPGEQRTPRAVRRWRILDWRFQLAYAWQDITHWSNRHNLREPARRCNRRAGYVDVFEGSGGVLVQAHMFDKSVFDIPQEFWSVDDIWLSANLEHRGVPIWLPANILEQKFSAAEPHAALSSNVNDNAVNAMAIRHAQSKLRVWR